MMLASLDGVCLCFTRGGYAAGIFHLICHGWFALDFMRLSQGRVIAPSLSIQD